MRTDTGKLKAVELQAGLVGLAEQRGKGSVRYHESWTLDDPYEPPPLPACGRPALPEHDQE